MVRARGLRTLRLINYKKFVDGACAGLTHPTVDGEYLLTSGGKSSHNNNG